MNSSEQRTQPPAPAGLAYGRLEVAPAVRWHAVQSAEEGGNFEPLPLRGEALPPPVGYPIVRRRLPDQTRGQDLSLVNSGPSVHKAPLQMLDSLSSHCRIGKPQRTTSGIQEPILGQVHTGSIENEVDHLSQHLSRLSLEAAILEEKERHRPQQWMHA